MFDLVTFSNVFNVNIGECRKINEGMYDEVFFKSLSF